VWGGGCAPHKKQRKKKKRTGPKRFPKRIQFLKTGGWGLMREVIVKRGNAGYTTLQGKRTQRVPENRTSKEKGETRRAEKYFDTIQEKGTPTFGEKARRGHRV